MVEVADEVEVTTMGAKGQVVIPKSVRERLGLGERAKFVVYGQGDTILLKHLTVPDLEAEFDRLLDAIEERWSSITEEEVLAEVKAVRNERRRETS